jgi:hypothetical protein
MNKKKSFKEFHEGTLNESSWLSKGFALGQGSRHSSAKRSLESLVNQVKTVCEAGKRAEELDEKLDELFDALIKLAQCHRLQSELSQSVINVGIASNVLEANLERLIKSK